MALFFCSHFFLGLILQVFSAPMGQIFERLLAFGEFEVGECVRVFSAMFFSLLMWIFGLFMNQLEMAEFGLFHFFRIADAY